MRKMREQENLIGPTLTPKVQTPEFNEALVEFRAVAFSVAAGITNSPEVPFKQAIKKGIELGLTTLEISIAMQTVQEDFKVQEDNFFVCESLSKAHQQFIEATEAKVRRTRILPRENALKMRYKKLMKYSDQEINLINSNPGIDFSADPLFPHLDQAGQKSMMSRSLCKTKEEYDSKLAEASGQQNNTTPDTLKLSVNYFDYDINRLCECLGGKLEQDQPLQHRLGKERFPKLIDCVRTLIDRGEIEREEVTAYGLSPDEVYRKAQRMVANFYIEECNSQKEKHRPIARAASHKPYARSAYRYKLRGNKI